MQKLFLIPAALMLLISCAPSPRNIDYGLELCAFCKMTVVDKAYAAEAVTSKGKVYVFDAIECMVHFEDKNPEIEYAYQLVTRYGNPGVLSDAHTSAYLISENMPSPMGANLTAFKSIEHALELQELNGGKVFTWEEMKKEILHDKGITEKYFR